MRILTIGGYITPLFPGNLRPGSDFMLSLSYQTNDIRPLKCKIFRFSEPFSFILFDPINLVAKNNSEMLQPFSEKRMC